jgi:hypothetical protein
MNTTTNQSAITVITMTIAAMAAACVGSVCLLSYRGIQIPPELNTLTGGLVGALTAMLVKTSPTETVRQPTPSPVSSGDGPTQVAVVSSEVNPVHTEEANPK